MKKGLILFIVVGLAAVAAAAQSKTGRLRSSQPGSASRARSTEPASSESLGQTAVAQKTVKAAVDCGCDGEAPPEVLASVNGSTIRIGDVDKQLQEEIDSLRAQVVEARTNELGLQVNSRLLEAEARRLSITVERLLQQEVVSKAKEPAETEIRIFYDDNKERIQAEYDVARPHILKYLLTQRQQAQAAKLADRLRAASDLKFLVAEPTPPENEGDRERLFATVNGQSIKSGQIEDAIAPLIFSFQERVYDMRSSRLESMISSRLLDQEAARRKLTPTALLEVETKRANEVTEGDARRFYDENKSRITGDYAAQKAQILSFVREQERRKAEAELSRRLRNAASIQIFLKPPDTPAFAFSIEDQPYKGSADAPVTIVEFIDFECSTCASTQPVLEELLAEYDGKVKLVVRDFPLENHKNSLKAAEAAEAARAQGKYWEYTALMFRNQGSLDPMSLKQYAGRLGLDREKFNSELDSGKYFDLVNRDRQDGLWLAVNATPSLFVNGRRVPSIAKEAVKTAIENALKARAESTRKTAGTAPNEGRPRLVSPR